jgi:hypothetical protein
MVPVVAAGRYGIYNNFNAFCGGWGPLAAFSAPNFLNIDGADNGINTMTDLWISNVVLTANTDYCFSFRWASAYANADANFNIEIYIENGAVDEVLGTTRLCRTPSFGPRQATIGTLVHSRGLRLSVFGKSVAMITGILG